jgi:protein AFG1
MFLPLQSQRLIYNSNLSLLFLFKASKPQQVHWVHSSAKASNLASQPGHDQHQNQNHKNHHRSGPKAEYERRIKQGLLKEDLRQAATIQKLQEMYERLLQYTPPPVIRNLGKLEVALGIEKGKNDIQSPDFNWIQEQEASVFSSVKSWFSSIKGQKGESRKLGPHGLYLYGSVGTGKTLLMDLFYHSVTYERKKRVHFHAFMQEIHKLVHQLRVNDKITSDPIPLIAKQLVNESWLLCFDELQVTDITDAMILR